MDDDGCTIEFSGEAGCEARWWATVIEPHSAEVYAERYGGAPMPAKRIRDTDPSPQPPRTLEPLEHGPGPLLDASEA